MRWRLFRPEGTSGSPAKAVDLAEDVVHLAAGGFREPVVDPAKEREQRARESGRREWSPQ